MKARKLIDEVVKRPAGDGEVLAIISKLKAAGLYVATDEPQHGVRVKFDDDPEGEAVELMTGKRSKITFLPMEDEGNVNYDVFPRCNWERYVKGHGGSHGGAWCDESEEKGGVFEKIISGYGYELGCAGGHPPNFDYSKEYGNLTVTFSFWGNPYHV